MWHQTIIIFIQKDYCIVRKTAAVATDYAMTILCMHPTTSLVYERLMTLYYETEKSPFIKTRLTLSNDDILYISTYLHSTYNFLHTNIFLIHV